MKNIFITLFILASSFISLFAQDQSEKQLGVLESDSTWLKEIITFPIGFAPEIKYQGYEDLRFAKKWRDKAHSDFWCYMFVWHIEGIQDVSVKVLEQQVKFYYDGLMKAVNKKKDFEVPETIVHFIKAEDDINDIDYKGKIRVHDSFNTEALMTLNVQVSINNCDKTNTSNIVFRLSPLDFDQSIWQRFKEIKLKEGICN